VELRKHKYVNWKRRGMGKTNIYYILDYKPLKIELMRTLVLLMMQTPVLILMY